ncbi:MAG: bifunctional precorrin-2 dehydrogenase/sirohydrochlorin ferrochelatase [Clostridia bacterium]|nr:bifunctional precorrin-2 dehydrogenase/sirohydrochlorin ferrochelatase [Clostridia bacterium]
MAMFPAFIDIKGKKCVVVGGGKVATRKIETLLKFEPRIVVVSPEISERIQALKWEDKVVVIKKKYSSEDLEGACLVIAATDHSSVNDRVFQDAQKSGILVNIADDPDKCTFIFPSVIMRDDLVVGISTSGSFPALSKMIRERVEQVLPEFYEGIVGVLKDCRERALREIEDVEIRQKLMNRLLDEVLFYEDAIPFEHLMQRIDCLFEEYKNEKNH